MTSNMKEKVVSLNVFLFSVILCSLLVGMLLYKPLHVVYHHEHLLAMLLPCLACVDICVWYYINGGAPVSVFGLSGSCAILGLAFISLYLIPVMFGAPLTTSVNETSCLSLVLVVCCVLPLVCVLGTNSDSWMRVVILNRVESEAELSVLWCGLGGLLGAWIGAATIPLDWDRPWQVWPVSCVVGSLLGYMGSLLFTAVYIYRSSDTDFYYTSKNVKIY